MDIEHHTIINTSKPCKELSPLFMRRYVTKLTGLKSSAFRGHAQ